MHCVKFYEYTYDGHCNRWWYYLLFCVLPELTIWQNAALTNHNPHSLCYRPCCRSASGESWLRIQRLRHRTLHTQNRNIRQVKSEGTGAGWPGHAIDFGIRSHEDWVIWGYIHNSSRVSSQKYHQEVCALDASENHLQVWIKVLIPHSRLWFVRVRKES